MNTASFQAGCPTLGSRGELWPVTGQVGNLQQEGGVEERQEEQEEEGKEELQEVQEEEKKRGGAGGEGGEYR